MRAADPAQKAIVFSSFTRFLGTIEAHLCSAGFTTCRFVGSMSQQHRADVMREFDKDGGPNVMVISLKAGNAGINLVRANHVYLMDPWCVCTCQLCRVWHHLRCRWNTSVEQQAADRSSQTSASKCSSFLTLIQGASHGAGDVGGQNTFFSTLKILSQTRDVRVVKFVIENSIEQRILEIQQRKNVCFTASCPRRRSI
jgi:SNF2 family DNA or RNA helicase